MGEFNGALVVLFLDDGQRPIAQHVAAAFLFLFVKKQALATLLSSNARMESLGLHRFLKMPDLPVNILEFMTQHHVLSLATMNNGELWAASCFYVLEVDDPAFLMLSDVNTRHGQMLLQQPQVAGTISAQPANWRDIRGLQFAATAFQLTGEVRDKALRRYAARHPLGGLAGLAHINLWRLSLNQIKLTDNRFVFAQKTHWARHT